jgi:hypothetical protein
MNHTTIEQMARDLLSQAVKDRLLALDYRQWSDPNPQKRKGEEIVGVANMLAKFLESVDGLNDPPMKRPIYPVEQPLPRLP